jgi:hypothetical protein
VNVAQFLAGYPPEVRHLVEELGRLLRSILTDAEERVNAGGGGLAYHDPAAGYVCGIFPRESDVRLLFEHGAALEDPDGLFDGGGKQTRYITLRPGDDLPEAAIRRMIDRAVLRGVVRRRSR